jgi:hypothetical protein
VTDNGRPTPIAGPKRAKERLRADDLLVAGVASGLSLREAAARANLSERTAKRRSVSPAFQSELTAARARMLDDALGRLSYAAAAAAATLARLLGTHHPAGVRLRAAVSILEAAVKLRQAVEWEERLSALEQRMGTNGKHGGWR